MMHSLSGGKSNSIRLHNEVSIHGQPAMELPCRMFALRSANASNPLIRFASLCGPLELDLDRACHIFTVSTALIRTITFRIHRFFSVSIALDDFQQTEGHDDERCGENTPNNDFSTLYGDSRSPPGTESHTGGQ